MDIQTLLALIGEQTVAIYELRRQLAELNAQLTSLKNAASAADPSA